MSAQVQPAIPRHVFLDFGGTLAYERPARAEVYAQAARRRGLPVGTREMGALMSAAHARLPASGKGGWRYSEAWFRGFMETIFVEGLGLERSRLDSVATELFERFADPATFQLYPGALELLQSLDRAGIMVGILSNWSSALPRLLRGLGLTPLTGPVLVSADEGLEKPDPAFFRLALERAGARPESSLHAGDRADLDCAGALAVGMRTILVDHRPSSTEAGPSEVVRAGSLHELEGLILGGPS